MTTKRATKTSKSFDEKDASRRPGRTHELEWTFLDAASRALGAKVATVLGDKEGALARLDHGTFERIDGEPLTPALESKWVQRTDRTFVVDGLNDPGHEVKRGQALSIGNQHPPRRMYFRMAACLGPIEQSG